MDHIVVGVGIACIDILVDVETYPDEDSEGRALAMSRRLGGNAANTLRVLSQLRTNQVRLIASLPAAGTSVVLDSAPLDTSWSVIHPEVGEAPTSVIVRARDTGSRTIRHFRPLNLPELVAGETISRLNQYARDSKRVKWIHFEGRSNVMILKGLMDALAAWVEGESFISIELEKPNVELLEAIAAADVVFLSKAYVQSPYIAAKLGIDTSTSPIEMIRVATRVVKEMSPRPEAIIVCAWGEYGAGALGELGYEHVPAEHVSRIVDSVGAGDSFIAGFIHASLANLPLRERLRIACQVAARKISTEGFSDLDFPRELVSIDALSTE